VVGTGKITETITELHGAINGLESKNWFVDYRTRSPTQNSFNGQNNNFRNIERGLRKSVTAGPGANPTDYSHRVGSTRENEHHIL